MISKLNFYLNFKDKILLLILLIIFLFNSFLEVISISSIPILIGYLVDPNDFINKIPIESFKYFFTSFAESKSYSDVVYFACITIFLIFIIKNSYYFLSYLFELNVSKRIILSINLRLFKSYLLAPYEMHLLTNPSFILRNLLASNVASNQIITYLRLLKEIILVLGIIFLIFYFSYDFSIIIILFIFLMLLIIFTILSNTAKYRSEKNAINQNAIIKIINQFIGAILEIKTKNKGNFFLNQYKSRIFEYETNNLYIKMLKSIPKIFIEIIAGGGLLLIVFYSTKNSDLNQVLPYLALLTLSIVRLLPSSTTIMSSMTDIKQQKIYFDTTYNELKKYENFLLNNEISYNKKEIIKINSSIELRDVSFSYKSSNFKVLKNINLKIKKGEKVGILGASGSGKSTLIKIILGLLKSNKGDFLIDGLTVKNFYNKTISNASYVPQEPYILDESVKNNIAFGSSNKNLNTSKILKIIKCVELNSLIDENSDGIDTKVGDRGIRISGGQKQRLALARALYSEPDILFLDEATSNIDLETEKIINQNLKKYYKETTVISISHKKDAFYNYDSVYNMIEGSLSKKL